MFLSSPAWGGQSEVGMALSEVEEEQQFERLVARMRRGGASCAFSVPIARESDWFHSTVNLVYQARSWFHQNWGFRNASLRRYSAGRAGRGGPRAGEGAVLQVLRRRGPGAGAAYKS